MTYSPTNICSTIGPLLIRGINDIYKKKREPQLLEVLLKKSGDDLLSHKHLQYHRRCWA